MTPDIALAGSIQRWLRVRDGERLLHYLCGDGALVEGFRSLGVQAWGYQPGDRALPESQFVESEFPEHSYSYVLAFKFTDHDDEELMKLLSMTWSALMISVEVTEEDQVGEWMLRLEGLDPNMTITASYNIPGLHFHVSDNPIAFLTCRRSR